MKDRCNRMFWKDNDVMRVGVALIAVLLLLTGCKALTTIATAHNVRVSDRQELWGGYRQYETYVLINDVFLEKRQDWAKYPVLVAPSQLRPVGQMEWSSPQNVEDYELNREDWPEVIGIVTSGTQLRVTDLWQRWTQICSWLWVSAEVLDGPYAGEIVDIMDLSTSTAELEEFDLLGPDPKVLKPISALNSSFYKEQQDIARRPV